MINVDGKKLFITCPKLINKFEVEGKGAIAVILLTWYDSYMAKNPNNVDYRQYLKFARI
jgi:hypothetical protein